MTNYVVSAPMVYLKVPDAGGAWVLRDFYQGAPVPEGIEAANLQHHIDSGLVLSTDDELAEIVAVPLGTPIPGEPPNVPVGPGTSTLASQDPSLRLDKVRAAAAAEGGGDGAPPKSAPKQDWVEYARRQGAPESVGDLTKEEILAQYAS